MAAEQYIHGAREIVRRRSDAERLAREAAMSRRALTMHMAVAHQRDTYWIRVASDLKKRVERDHHDLDVSLKALTHLLDELPATRKELAPHIDASLLLEEEAPQGPRARRASRAARRGRARQNPPPRRAALDVAQVVAALRGHLDGGGCDPGRVILATADEPQSASALSARNRRAGAPLHLGWVVERLKRKP